MAIIPISEPFFVLSSTNGSNTYVLGTGSDADASTFTVQLNIPSALSASIVVVARSSAVQATADAVPFVATEYRKLWLNGAAGDGSLVATAITGNSLIVIPATGLQIGLLVTYTSGTGTVYIARSIGPSVL